MSKEGKEKHYNLKNKIVSKNGVARRVCLVIIYPIEGNYDVKFIMKGKCLS